MLFLGSFDNVKYCFLCCHSLWKIYILAWTIPGLPLVLDIFKFEFSVSVEWPFQWLLLYESVLHHSLFYTFFFFLALNSFSHSVFLLFFFISFLFSSYPCYSKISYVILHQDLCCFWSNILLLPASPWNLCFSFSRTTFNSYSLTPICLLLLFICPFF